MVRKWKWCSQLNVEDCIFMSSTYNYSLTYSRSICMAKKRPRCPILILRPRDQPSEALHRNPKTSRAVSYRARQTQTSTTLSAGLRGSGF